MSVCSFCEADPYENCGTCICMDCKLRRICQLPDNDTDDCDFERGEAEATFFV